MKLGVNLQGRFDPSVLKVREAVETGRLGRLFLRGATVEWFRAREHCDKKPLERALSHLGGQGAKDFWRGGEEVSKSSTLSTVE